MPEPMRSWGDDCRFDLRVLASSREVARVRRALEALDLPPALLEDAELLVSELLSNSIRHAGLAPQDQVRVTADWSGSRLRVEVRDPGSRPRAQDVAGGIRPPLGAESGWGLYLVDRLGSRWGFSSGRTWFELESDAGADPPS